MNKQKGKLIVIEGSDGAGKGTQLSLLIEHCKQNNIPHQSFDFPQYYKTFFGAFAGRFLKGEFGNINDIPPYVISIPYAADRWQAKEEINQALSEGKLVIVNRYATSNAAYQGAKLPESERQKFIDWSFDMEYNQFAIPKEDLVLYLHVPFSVSQTLIEQKAQREYLGTDKKDIHEANVEFLKEVEKVYRELAKTSHWVTIECCKDNDIFPKDVIHKQIISALTNHQIL